MSAPHPEAWIAVFDHDGDHEREGGAVGPFVFETYLPEATREAAQARIGCTAARTCGEGRVARLDFELQGEPSDPHVVVAGFDGVNRERGPLVWETVLRPPYSTRDGAQRHAALLEHGYGACRIARVVFDDAPT